MEILSLIFFVLMMILSMISIIILLENIDKEHIKYHGKDV